MKIISLLLLAAASASAFVIQPISPQTATAKATTTLKSSIDYDNWSDKQLDTPVSTEPQYVRPPARGRAFMKDVVLEPNFFFSWSLVLVGATIMWYHPSTFADGSESLIGICGGLFHMLFAALLWIQTLRVRCVFEKDGFEFYNLKGPGLSKLEKKPDNYVSGTRNRWSYDKITNWGFFPSIEFPVIVFFKETETPESQWNKWFAAFDSYGRGQPHFFPGIVNCHQFKEQMELRGAKKKFIPTMKKNKKN